MAFIIGILEKEIKAWDQFRQRHNMEDASGVGNVIDEGDDRCA